MTAPAKSALVSDSVKEGVFRFLADFRAGYDATSFGIYYRGFDLFRDAQAMEDAGHIAEVRFYRDRTGRIDGLELVRLSPKAPTLRVVEDEGNGSIEGGDTTAASTGKTPSDLDSQPVTLCMMSGCTSEEARNGLCDSCAAEVEADIALDDIERPAPLPRPYYGTNVDPFGGAA